MCIVKKSAANNVSICNTYYIVLTCSIRRVEEVASSIALSRTDFGAKLVTVGLATAIKVRVLLEMFGGGALSSLNT